MSTDAIYEQAARWLVLQHDEAVDWAAFTAWLEADPRHRAAYDELALIDRQLDDHSQLLSVAEADEDLVLQKSRGFRWGRWAGGAAGGAIAAGLALLMAVQPTHQQVPVRDYRSSQSQMLPVALDKGVNVVLAPASVLTVQGTDMTLRGAAYFDVEHQPSRPLSVRIGDFQVTDIGTRFAIENDSDALSVDVATGSIVLRSDRLVAPLSIPAGHGIRADLAKGVVRVVTIDPQGVASWRTGKLQFDNLPLALVARDISRYSGEKVTVDPAIAEQPFSGVIAIRHGEAPAQTLAQILSLNVKKMDGSLRLEPHRR